MNIVDNVNKLLAYGFLIDFIKKRKNNKIKEKATLRAELVTEDGDQAEFNFGEIESHYHNILSSIENSPTVRASVVTTLKNLYQRGEDLNELYDAKDIVSDNSIKKIIFLDDYSD